jgi:hypothetical protein
MLNLHILPQHGCTCTTQTTLPWDVQGKMLRRSHLDRSDREDALLCPGSLRLASSPLWLAWAASEVACSTLLDLGRAPWEDARSKGLGCTSSRFVFS